MLKLDGFELENVDVDFPERYLDELAKEIFGSDLADVDYMVEYDEEAKQSNYTSGLIHSKIYQTSNPFLGCSPRLLDEF